MGLPMFGQVMRKFSLNQLPLLSHKFTIGNSFYYSKFCQASGGKVGL